MMKLERAPGMNECHISTYGPLRNESMVTRNDVACHILLTQAWFSPKGTSQHMDVANPRTPMPSVVPPCMLCTSRSRRKRPPLWSKPWCFSQLFGLHLYGRSCLFMCLLGENKFIGLLFYLSWWRYELQAHVAHVLGLCHGIVLWWWRWDGSVVG